ncbi:MAG: terminase family protein [Porticoccaceae bacterium]|nr:terminase family protein [Porticoccaceae bacterium]
MSTPMLYPYQRKWLADQSRFKVGMFARQTGKTFTTTLELVLDCLRAEAEGKRARWVILSRGERQAREAMEEGVKQHLKAVQAAFEYLELEHEEAKVKSLEVTLPGGSRITALPANPDTARGFSANVFLDEFAFHADSRKIWMALFPVISAGWKLRVVSTPNGKGNKFYELMTGEDAAWSRHTVDIYQAVADGLPRNVDELRTGLKDEDAWSQEFELNWLDEASAWLSYDLINAVEHDSAGDPATAGSGPIYIGNDIGRKKDLWVAWVWERVGDVLWTREVVTLKRATFRVQDQVLDELVTKYNPVRICMDQTGMGEKPVEDAQHRYGAMRVEGVMFTGDSKQHMANLAKEAFEDRKVRIPLGDDAIRADLHSLKKVTTPAGNVRFDVEGGDGHADRAWAAFLGIYAASGPTWKAEWTPAPSAKSQWDDIDDDSDIGYSGSGGW